MTEGEGRDTEGSGPTLLEENATPAREVGNRVRRPGYLGLSPEAPPSEEPRYQVASPSYVHPMPPGRAPTLLPALPGPQRLTEDIFPVQKGHFAQDSDSCLLQPVLGPALGSLHELGHLSKGRGAHQRSGGRACDTGHQGPPTPPRPPSRGYSHQGPGAHSSTREVAAVAKSDSGAVSHLPGGCISLGELTYRQGEALA